MAYPALITNDPITFPIGNSYPGPFSFGGNFYCFPMRTPGPTGFANAYKSTDQGNTWIQVGGDSDPVKQVGEYSVISDGTKAYIVCLNDLPGGGSSFVQIIAFDPATDTFSPAVVTANTTLDTGLTSDLAAAFQSGTNSIIVCAITAISPDRTSYFVYDIGTATAGGWIPNGETGVSPNSWDCRRVVRGNGFVHFAFRSAGVNFTAIHTQSLSDGGVLSAVQNIDSAASDPSKSAVFSCGDGTGLTVVMGWVIDKSVLNPTAKVFSGASASTVTFLESDVVYTGAIAGTDSVCVARSDGKTFIFFIGIFGFSNDGYNIDPGSGFGAFQDLGDNDYVQPYADELASVGLIVLGNLGLFFYLFVTVPPPPASTGAAKQTAGGGTYFPRFINKTLLHAQIARIVGKDPSTIFSYRQFAPLSWLYDFPNGNDLCLSREWRLFNQIDPTALACARKPDCFTGDEYARPWVDAPAGAVTFNPDKAIPLPNPVLVDVVVLSFRVPIGFDGIVLAQYHGYAGGGTFVEASGDIVWRVRVNGRYLRDMGNMLLSLGSPQMLSPCPGGLWLHSGNLVEYVVSAPNTSGNLPLPGQGNILAGLHGWFFPRI